MHAFQPINTSDLCNFDLSCVLSLLVFINPKRCGQFKSRVCDNVSPQRLIHKKIDASSSTLKTKSVILASVFDADESRFVGVHDIPDAFFHSKLDEVVYMKVTGALPKYLVAFVPEVHGDYVTMEREKEVIYLLLTRALYGCVMFALTFWNDLSGHLQD
jgi:hypothetical protein